MRSTAARRCRGPRPQSALLLLVISCAMLFVPPAGASGGEDRGRTPGDDLRVDNGDLRFYHGDGTPVSYSSPASAGETLGFVLSVHSDSSRYLNVTVFFNVSARGEGGLPLYSAAVNVTVAPSGTTEAGTTWVAQLGEFDVGAMVIPPPGSDDEPGDNDARRPLSVQEGADLEVMSLALSNYRVREGETITVSAVIENFSNTTVEFSIELLEVTDDDTSVAGYNESSIPADAAVTQMFSWTAAEGVRGLMVRVEPLGRLEKTPGDNEATVDVEVLPAREDDGDDGGVEVPGFGAWGTVGAVLASLIVSALCRDGYSRRRQ